MKRVFILGRFATIILFIVTNFAIVNFFLIANLVAAEEGKIAAEEECKELVAKWEYDNQLTKELEELYKSYPLPWSQEVIDKIQILICNGANPNTGSCPLLYLACNDNHISLIETCLRYGAKVNEVAGPLGETALLTVKSGESLQLLLDAHADANVRKNSRN